MPIWTNLYSGTSGLAAHGDAISVVGDNIANVSTTGYHASRAGFEDVLGGQINGNRLGAGTRMSRIDTSFTQGSLQSTGGVLDMAIRGSGFFVVRGNHNGIDGQFFSRDGRFQLDAEGSLVNGQGLKVQGYLIDPSGRQNTSPADLNLGAGQSPPLPTSDITMAINLDANATPPAAWDPANPGDTSNFATSATVYDSVGAPHRVEVFFRTSGAGAWEWHAMADGGELNGGTPGTATEIASGTLGYTTDGALDTEVTAASSADFLNATPGQVLNFDFGDSITTDGGTGLAGSTQFSGDSTVTAVEQNGYGFGSLVDVQVADDGTITGVFSNGQRRPMARLALATFASEAGLERAGSSLYSETRDSGQPIVDAASEGGRGSISAGNLEASNVDLSTELVTLIAYQRAFQANVRTVTTADEMLNEVANLKR